MSTRSSQEKLKVFVRVRPFLPSETNADNNKSRFARIASSAPVVQITDSKTLIYNPSELKTILPVNRFTTTRTRVRYDQQYCFDECFDWNTSESTMFSQVAEPLLDSALEGHNSTLFAYGATGCGKSHTVSSINERVGNALFEKIKEQEGMFEYKVSMSYVQLYNEKLLDLIPDGKYQAHKSQMLNGLKLLEGSDRPSVVGLSSYDITCAEDIHTLCQKAYQVRCTAATKVNAQSSRSHALLMLTIKCSSKLVAHDREATLTIIDLAGSERAQSTENRGVRLKEGAKINQSLLALGKCINARARNQRFVPYRESKLTRLLRPCFEGQCKASMIVCVSPSMINFDETHYSLEYGQRVMCVTAPARKLGTQERKLEVIRELEDKLKSSMLWRHILVTGLVERYPAMKNVLRKHVDVADIPVKDLLDLLDSCVDCKSQEARSSPINVYENSISPVKRLRRVI
ncbi:hypothetical protein DASB73_023010 [Starmerella bacillaris]|uniref:Kinesin-like protein n=1 Tax=Starmerella bacillaris TaxID=1247836 RepID=A0AAV5RKT4_STABA|nr:hypothetical protein DASB73_023010 [Starmerella bacillaris]